MCFREILKLYFLMSERGSSRMNKKKEYCEECAINLWNLLFLGIIKVKKENMFKKKF